MNLHGVIPPTLPTLRRYGLTLFDWAEILERQGWLCPICERHASRVKLNIDHEHVLGWKRLPPELRRLHVRGVLCAHCNWRVMMDPTPPAGDLERLAAYVRDYEKRRAAAPSAR